jgi:hypothetical protein
LLRLLCVCFAFKSFESGRVRFITRPKSRTIMLCRFCFCSLKLIDHGSITRLNASDLALSNGGLLGDASAVGRSALFKLLGRLGGRSLVPAVCTVGRLGPRLGPPHRQSLRPTATVRCTHRRVGPQARAGSGARSPRQSPTHLH